MTTYVVSSDSDDNLPLGFAGGSGKSDAGSDMERPLVGADAAGSSEDPDWVKAFTPTKAPPPRPRRERLLSVGAPSNALADGSDDEFNFSDDSVLDLVDDDVEEDDGLNRTADGGDSPSESKEEGEKAGDASAKAAKAAAKPKRGPVKSSLPLVVAPKLDDGLVLVQAQSVGLDLSGDVGAVGRVKIGKDGLSLDVKGTLYSCDVHETNMICVVTVGDEEAKITAAFEEVLTLHEDKTTFAAGEHLLSGALDEELADENEEDATQAKAKTKAKTKVVKPKAKATRAKKAKPRSKAKTKPKPKAKAS